jgi:hypothetical protein
MPATFLEKLLYPLAAFVLHLQGRVPAIAAGGAALDLVWLVLFIAAWVKTKE